MKQLRDYGQGELKLVYRVLHARVLAEVQLLDSDLFSDLQAHLQREAEAEGVDVTDHAAWEGWLEDAVPAPGAAGLDGRASPGRSLRRAEHRLN